MSCKGHARTFSQCEINENCPLTPNLESTLLKSKLAVEHSLNVAKQLKNKKLALDSRLKAFNCKVSRPQSSMELTNEESGHFSKRFDKSQALARQVATLEDLLQAQALKYDELLQEHNELKGAFYIVKDELLIKEEEVTSLRGLVKQQSKENDNLRKSLKATEAQFAKCKEVVDAKDCVCQRLKAEVAQLQKAMASMSNEHKAELLALETKLTCISDISKIFSVSSSADNALIARVSELEEKLEGLVAKQDEKRAASSKELLRTPSLRKLCGIRGSEQKQHKVRILEEYYSSRHSC
mmetsp:Transcript_29048/g.51985  ORF Transcript_29048/g.51985 Transcript_29048/m.51985 type:complete len:296 (-) Transcript_29048:67-954(-)